MSLYAYCRVSTKNQSLKRQYDNIAALYPDAIFYSEKYTGTTADRPEWKKLKAKVKEGDTIVFDSVSRMSRNATEGAEEYKYFFESNVNLIFLNEPFINTDVYRNSTNKFIPMTNTNVDIILSAVNQYLLVLAFEQVKLAFEQAEKEVQDTRKRVKQGMKASGANEKIRKARQGKTFETAKAKAAKEIILKHSKTFGGTLSDNELMQFAGITHNSLYKYKAELKAENENKTDD